MARLTTALLLALIGCFFLNSVSACLATATKCPATPPEDDSDGIHCMAIMEVTVYYKDGTSGIGEGGCVDPCSNPDVIAWEPLTISP